MPIHYYNPMVARKPLIFRYILIESRLNGIQNRRGPASQMCLNYTK